MIKLVENRIKELIDLLEKYKHHEKKHEEILRLIEQNKIWLMRLTNG